MGKLVEAMINPAILKWVRQEQGYDLQVAKTKFKDIVQWENGDAVPSMAQIRSLASFYKRPSAIFFLPVSPENHESLVDYRLAGNQPEKQLSPNARTEIRVCESRRKSALAACRPEGVRTFLRGHFWLA